MLSTSKIDSDWGGAPQKDDSFEQFEVPNSDVLTSLNEFKNNMKSTV